MIYPSWLLLCMIGGPAVAGALGIGFVLKRALGSEWYAITFALLFLAVPASGYLIATYRPTYKVVIDAGFTGKVMLFISRNANGHEIPVNRYGVGYISEETFEKGFYPRIQKGGKDISKEVTEYFKGSMGHSEKDRYRFEYLSFYTPGVADSLGVGVDSLLKAGAIDTARLLEQR